jgi:hypothetical protein
MPKAMQLKEVPLVALHWQAACYILSQNLWVAAAFVLSINYALARKGHSVKTDVREGHATQAGMARRSPFSWVRLLGMLLVVRIFCGAHG